MQASPPPPARRRNRGRIDNVAFDSFLLQRAMKPEAIETRFLDDHDRKGFPRPCKRLLLQLRKPRQQPRNVPGSHRMLRHLLARARRQRCDEPDRAAEFQRDENRGKIGLDGGRRVGSVSYGWHGRLHSGRFCNLTLPELRSLSASPWDLPLGFEQHAPFRRSEQYMPLAAMRSIAI